MEMVCFFFFFAFSYDPVSCLFCLHDTRHIFVHQYINILRILLAKLKYVETQLNKEPASIADHLLYLRGEVSMDEFQRFAYYNARMLDKVSSVRNVLLVLPSLYSFFNFSLYTLHIGNYSVMFYT